ncbi:MAG: hypothetical protein AUH21_07035 [Nitrospirae bacterium 13_2_20CM_62_7]|nr:MAG: hypothetical protein AUH21_07035 [Nitrospirae bacterium 13_2_20CM_62_7]
MKITRGLADHKHAAHPVLTIGNFDGQHRGHLALLQTVVETATSKGGTPMVLTFDPHPITILKSGTELLLLTAPDEKLARFQSAGIEEVLFLEFNQAFAELTPDEFVLRILKDGIGVRDLFVGEHFAFGKGRAGRTADLIRLGARWGFQVHPVAAMRVDGEVVSSSRIRTSVRADGPSRAGGAPRSDPGLADRQPSPSPGPRHPRRRRVCHHGRLERAPLRLGDLPRHAPDLRSR